MIGIWIVTPCTQSAFGKSPTSKTLFLSLLSPQYSQNPLNICKAQVSVDLSLKPRSQVRYDSFLIDMFQWHPGPVKSRMTDQGFQCFFFLGPPLTYNHNPWRSRRSQRTPA